MNPTIEVMRPAFTSGDGYFYQARKHPFLHITVYFSNDEPPPAPYRKHFRRGQVYLVKTCIKRDRHSTLATVRRWVREGSLHRHPFSLLSTRR